MYTTILNFNVKIFSSQNLKRCIDPCIVLLALMCTSTQLVYAQSDLPATINVDLNKPTGKLNPVWAWFGHDEPNYTYMKDGRKLLSELSALSPVPVHLRVHNLLTSGDGTPSLKWGSTNAYTEDANGKPVYNWKITDSIFDTYIRRGIKPLAQIGFMPQALSTHPEPYRHNWHPGDPYSKIFTGWAYPPKDYNKWRELVYQWVKHCVGRYGKHEIESWYWEVWNEPNGYWKGTMQEFFKLYDYAVDGVKKALPTAKVGGCDIAGTSSPGAVLWLNAFIKHCISDTNYATGKIGSPLDVVLFHAKGSPKVLNGHVFMNMSPQLHDIETGFKTVASYPQIKNLPIVIGESDPEGCAACGMATNPENAYRNGTMYSSYTAASFAREYDLADKYGVNFLGSVSWSFEFEDQPWFYGFRDLATNGVDKPVLNVFRMFGKMKGNRVEVKANGMYDLSKIVDSSVRGVQTDIGGFASKDTGSAAIMIWNYHDEDVQGSEEPVQIRVSGLPLKKIMLTEYRIDNEHSNAYETWKKMGSPQNPTQSQISILEKAGQLQIFDNTRILAVDKGVGVINIALQRQGVAMLVMKW